MEDLSEVRKVVRRLFDLRDINLKPDALTFLTNFMKDKDYENMKEFSRKLVDVFITKNIDNDAISLEKLKLCLKNDKDESTTFTVINFMNSEYENKLSSSLEIGFSDALRSRYKIIKSKIDSISITSIELLYSKTKAVVTVLGMLIKQPSNKYIIEDDTGTLKIKLNQCVFSNGIFFEGGIYEFYGVYNYGTLFVEKISLPKLRKEEKINQNPMTYWTVTDTITILSDLWLDDDKTLKQVYKLFNGFKTSPPYMFIICGDFLSRQYNNSLQVIDKGFEHLANILLEFKKEFSKTKFIVVPSSNDFPFSTALPREELPYQHIYFKEFNNVHFTSNPTQIKAKNLTFYVIRDDLIEKTCRSAIKAPINPVDVPAQFCKTILCERHCSPLPVHTSPKILHKDDCFQFEELPDILIIADKYESFNETYNNCQMFNPGSFSKSNFEFMVYYPLYKQVELSSCTDIEKVK